MTGEGAEPPAGNGRRNHSYYRMTPFEIATGWLTGEDASADWSPPSRAGIAPLEALEAVLTPALARPPCVLAFSGGRDSSAVLAVARAVALREGLPPPIAATLRYTGDGAAEESEWQERVVRHLGVDDWERVPGDCSADLLGPVGTDGLRRRGLVWPPAHHTFIPLLRLAAGGTLVTGHGGDEVFGDRRPTPLLRLMAGRLPRRSTDAMDTLLALAPRTARRRMFARALRADSARSWLRPAARDRFAAALAADQAAEPLTWAASTLRLRRMRAWRAGFRNQDLVAAEEGAAMLRPLQDRLFLDALVRHTPRWGFADREAAMRSIFSPVVPGDVLGRRSKAVFNRVVFGHHSREFAARWTGHGVPADLVDPEVLLRFWQARVPHALSFALLQSAWLAEQGTV